MPMTPPALAKIDGISEFEDLNPDPNILEVNLRAEQAQVEISPGHVTNVLAFNGQTPGPMLHARVGDRVIVHFENGLAEETMIHWHGLRIHSDMDGNPMVSTPIPAGGTFTYDFVVPDAGTFWYHPHASEIEQIERGLYGPIVVEEKDAPKFTSERIFVLDDIRFDKNFQVAPFGDPMDMMMGRWGSTLLVNGKTKLATGSIARGAIERWRFVNTAGARPMTVTMFGGSTRVIATDGGLVPEPYIRHTLIIAPGQRYDVELTADDSEATSIRIEGRIEVQQSDGSFVDTPFTLADWAIDGSVEATPPSYPAVTMPDIADAPSSKQLRLGMTQDVQGNMTMTINGMDGRKLPVAEYPQNAPVRFTIVNDDKMHLHPFHFHGQFFQILTKNGKPANEPGLKDTVLVEAGMTVTILTYFENAGDWMYHCHIPEHAMEGMMAELRVTP